MRLAVLLLLVLGLLGCEALYGGLSGHNPGYCRGCTADQVCNDKGFCVSADGGAADADGGPPAMRVELLPVSVDNLKPNLRALTVLNEDEVWIGGASNAVVRVSRPVSGGAYKLDNFAGGLGLTSETVAMASNAASVGLLFRSGGYRSSSAPRSRPCSPAALVLRRSRGARWSCRSARCSRRGPACGACAAASWRPC